MNPWWAVVGWAVVGAAIGATLRWPVRSLLTIPGRDHPLTGPVVLGSTTATVFGLLVWRIGTHLELLAYSGLAAVCVPLAAIDLIEQRMSARLLLPAYPAFVVLFGLAAVVGHHGTAMLRALAGMAILFLFYLVIALAARDSVGAADIRLAGLLGLALAWRGWTTLVAGTILALLYASLTGATLIILRRASRHTPIPFGPALIAGAFTAILLPIE